MGFWVDVVRRLEAKLWLFENRVPKEYLLVPGGPIFRDIASVKKKPESSRQDASLDLLLDSVAHQEPKL